MKRKKIIATAVGVTSIMIAILFYEYAVIISEGRNKCSLSGRCENIQNVSFSFNKEDLSIVVNQEDKNCTQKEDCALFSPDCEYCKYETIKKKRKESYSNAKKEFCLINKPKKMCDSLFTGSLECINQTCEIRP